DSLSFDRFTRANELVTESVLSEPLRWLGILAIGLKDEKDIEVIGSRQGDGKTMKAKGGSRGRPRKQPQLEYTFRFTDLGRFIIPKPLNEWNDIFHRHDENEVFPLNFDVDSFIVQPTHEIIVPPDLQLPIFYKLNQLTHVKSIDVMSLMYMDKTSIRAALDRGWEAEEILEFLANTSRTPIPDSLKHLVHECAEKHGQVNMGHAGGYIVVEDELMLNQMRGSKKIAQNIKTVIDNKVVLLSVDTDVKRLAREMQKIGFMPHLESEHVSVAEDTFTLSLNKDDMVRVIAAVRYVLGVKDEKGREVAHDRMSPLLERLKADPKTFAVLSDLADPLIRTWTTASENLLQSKIDEVRSTYESQVHHLVTNAVARPTNSKFAYDGANPAKSKPDMIKLIDFAIDKEFDLEIEYVKANGSEVAEIIRPESLESDRLFAFCSSRKVHCAYRLERILTVKLE
ncbi:MAG: helicase-associated domain-containing protein, partial [Candidatus Sumerlaeia bacterium]|nr:helicase-associated domain-containing protein [Candidatus Sumerlaeia bacterium]